jgi:hypothetical protein
MAWGRSSYGPEGSMREDAGAMAARPIGVVTSVPRRRGIAQSRSTRRILSR